MRASCTLVFLALHGVHALLKDPRHLHPQLRFVILFNLVSLGIEVDIAAKVGQNDVPKYFDYMNLIVVIIFIMELAVACLQVQASVPTNINRLLSRNSDYLYHCCRSLDHYVISNV